MTWPVVIGLIELLYCLIDGKDLFIRLLQGEKYNPVEYLVNE